jgi:hypothetical protein
MFSFFNPPSNRQNRTGRTGSGFVVCGQPASSVMTLADFPELTKLSKRQRMKLAQELWSPEMGSGCGN